MGVKRNQPEPAPPDVDNNEALSRTTAAACQMDRGEEEKDSMWGARALFLSNLWFGSLTPLP